MVEKIRKDTVDKTHGSLIDLNRQQFIGILGARGSGKSYLGDTFLEMYNRQGYTCLDLFSAPYYENFFWILPKDGLNADEKPFTKRIPITIVAPESLIVDQEGIDKFNAQVNTRYPLVRIVKLPTATVKAYSEQNDKILEIITAEILRCRDEHRILTFNTSVFPVEKIMYLTLEIIFRGILKVSNEHFYKLTEADVGHKLSTHEKNYHKMAFQLREIGQLFPSMVKGDQSGFSKNTKKGFMEFSRLARHGSIDGIFDYQNSSDTMSSIRNQIDVWCLKKWNRQLAGEQFDWIFPVIKSKRDFIAEKFRFNKYGWKRADSAFPMIESLNKTWFYGLIAGYNPKLFPVPSLGVRHKEPTDKWTKITGIKLDHDMSMIESASNAGKAKTSKKDEKDLYDMMLSLKSIRGNTWSDVGETLATKQKSGEIVATVDFSTASALHVGSKFAKLKKKFDKS
jgi:hypothetical protein